jgi:DNA-binding CsgD family transcriptional regulator
MYEKMTTKEQILSLYSQGKKQAEISRDLKVHSNYVWKVVREHFGKARS